MTSPRTIVQPPLALAREFLVIDLAGGKAPTRAEVSALLDGHPARWVVLRRWLDGAVGWSVVPKDDLRTIMANSPGDGPLAALRGLPRAAEVLSELDYRTSGIGGALVVEDDVPLGITEPRDGGTRGEASSRDVAAGDSPHRLDALMPARVNVGAVATLVVTLDRIERAAAVAGDLALPPGEPLEITVQGDARLQPDGVNSQPLAVLAGEDTAAVSFRFTALSAGPARVKVFAFRNGVSVARLGLGVDVALRHKLIEEPADTQAAAPIPPLVGTPPDLRLLVMEGSDRLRFQLWIGERMAEDYPEVIVQDLPQHMRQFAEAIEGLFIGKPEAVEGARRRLQAWGANLFGSLFPEPLQQLLWAQRERGSLTLQVCSDDAWIPWEACRLLRRHDDGRVEEGPFLAEAFAMTRWLHGRPAPAKFRMSRCALVVPEDSGLATAARERAYYRGMAGKGRVTEICARYLPLTRALESGQYDAWHFCGHANAGTIQQGDRATLRLDGNETMSADLFAGTVENALIPRPFIFFNACQSAMGGQAMTGVGGWARRFVRPNLERHGAAVFVGTYWSVYDAAAHRFATALYDGLRNELSIGAAALAARQRAKDPDISSADPLSWLAYTVYADPLARLEVS